MRGGGLVLQEVASIIRAIDALPRGNPHSPSFLTSSISLTTHPTPTATPSPVAKKYSGKLPGVIYSLNFAIDCYLDYDWEDRLPGLPLL